MNTQSWMVTSWPIVEWYLPLDTEEMPTFKHFATQVRDEDSATGLCTGESVWVAEGPHCAAGLAWEWLEIKRGVVMLADPNSLITNLQMVDINGKAVLGLAKTTQLNRIIHALPWQQAVYAQPPNGTAPVLARMAGGSLAREPASPQSDKPALQAPNWGVDAQVGPRVHPLRRSWDNAHLDGAHQVLPTDSTELRRAA